MNENYKIYQKTLLEKIFRTLNNEGVRYMVVGGVAVNLHGLKRATFDLDLLLFLNRANLKKMDSAMKKLGYTERNSISITSLGDHEQVKKWFKEKNFLAYSFLPPGDLLFQIDVIIEESLQFDKLNKKRIVKKEDDLMIPVVSIEDLIKMKKKAGRSRDLIDLDALLALKGL